MGPGRSVVAGACNCDSLSPHISVALKAGTREDTGLSYKPQGPPPRDLLSAFGPQNSTIPKGIPPSVTKCSVRGVMGTFYI